MWRIEAHMTDTNHIPESLLVRLKAAVAAFYAEHGRVPSVILDADEVIYPFWESFVPFHNARHPHLPAVVGPFPDYNMRQGLPEEVGEAIYESLNNLDWSTLYPHPQARPVLAALINAGVDLSVATAHLTDNLYQASAKVYQFKRDFNGHLDNRLVITQDKTRVLGDWLVDDKPEITGNLPAQWTQIVFDQSYNQHVAGPRANWDTIIAVLTELIEARVPGYEYVAAADAAVEAEAVEAPAAEAAPEAAEAPAAEAAVEAASAVPAVTLPWETEAAAEPVAETAAAVDLPWETETPAADAADVPPVTMPWETDTDSQAETAPATFGSGIDWNAVTGGGDSK